MTASLSRRGALGLVAASAFGLIACDDDLPDPTGDLERPAGLVVIERSGDPNAELGQARADLLIVDSEAQGVRVQQYLQTKELSGTSTLTVRQSEFVLGPAVLFPMVIPTEGFPTEISVIAERDRAYVIAPSASRRVPHGDSDLEGKPDLLGKKDPDAPTEARLYTIDVTEAASLPGRASDGGNQTLGFFVLDDPEQAAVPVDVVAWAGADEGTDRVLVLFDDLDGTGRVVAYDVSVDADPPQLEPLLGEAPADLSAPVEVFEVEVSSAPRQLVPMPRAEADDPRTFLVSNAGGDALGQLTVDGDSVTFAQIPGVGPTSRVVPVDATRALALRTDVPAAVALEADAAGAFAVSSRYFPSPYAPLGARGSTTSPGLIELSQVPVTGAVGTPGGFPNVEDPEVNGVVMLSLVDGTAVFLRAEDLSLVVSEASNVSVVRSLRETSDGTYVRECGAELLAWCVDEDDLPETCEGLVQAPRVDSATYRATFRGDLVSTRDWYFSASEGEAATFELGSDLAQHAVALGDEVLLEDTGSCIRRAAGGLWAGPWAAHGVVAAVDGRQVTVAFERIEGGITDDGTTRTADTMDFDAAGALDFSACEGASRLQIWPVEASVVLAEVNGSDVVAVHARARAQPGLAGSEIARIVERPEGGPAPLAFTLVAPSGFVFERGRTDDRPCRLDSDCGSGSCVETALNTDGTCPRRCDCPNNTSSEDGESGTCADAEWVYHRSGVELTVPGAEVERQDLGASDLHGRSTTTETLNAVPYETVWLEVFNQWVTSFPGSRTLVRLEYYAESERASATR